MASSEAEKKEREVSPWHALRDIGLALVSKDQFYQLAIFLGVVVLFWMLPEDIRGQIALRLLDDIEQGWLVGWIFAGLGFGGWAIHGTISRRKHQLELKRVAEERNLLQKQILKGLFESSNDDPTPDA